MALMTALCLLAAPAQPVTVGYRPAEGIFWDHWLFRASDGQYHLYYLYEPPGVPAERRGQSWTVGHATSQDLVTWQEQPIALSPRDGSWLDHHIATGSTIDFGGRFGMLVTGYGTRQMGFGLAFSDDLFHWQLHEEGPVIPPAGPWYETPEIWRHNPPECGGWADPYLFRRPGDEAVYAVFNARVREGDVYGRGSFALAKSMDLVHWELLPPVHVPGYCTRCETPQILTRGGRWYLIASMWPKLLTEPFKREHPEAEVGAAAMVWTAERFEGPYALRGDSALFRGMGCYIGKVIEAPDGGDVVTTIRMAGRAGLSAAYRVSYPAEGGIRVHLDQPLQ